MANIILKAHSPNNSTTVIENITQGSTPSVVKAGNQVNYELIDPATGLGPDNIVAKRVGNDIHLSISEDDTDTDLIIEDYYLNPNQNIIGVTEQGNYHTYITSSGDISQSVQSVNQLEDGAALDLVMAQEGMTSPLWMTMTENLGTVNGANSIGSNSLLLGAVGLGAVALAVDSDDDDDDNDESHDNDDNNNPPQNTVPTLTIDSTYDVTEDAATTKAGFVVVNYTTSDVNGDTVTVTLNDTTHYSLDGNGNVVLTQAGSDLANSGQNLPTFTLTPSDDMDSGEVVTIDPTVVTMNDAPTVTVSKPNTFSQNDPDTKEGAVVATITTSDEDSDTVTVAINDTDNYQIVGNEVQLTAAGAALVNAGTDLPTFELTPNDGTVDGDIASADPSIILAPEPTILEMGDVAVIGFNFDNPDKISFVLLSDIESGTQINFTDHGVKSDDTFRANEGVWQWQANSALSAGTVISIVNDAEITASTGSVTASGSLAFSGKGDQVVVFQGEVDNPNYIYALNSEGSEWQTDATNSNTSALPSMLQNGTTAIALAEIDNATYKGPTSGDKATLLAAISNPDNWTGDNATAPEHIIEPFIVSQDDTPDTTAPVLTDANPTDGESDFSLSDDLVLTFNEQVQAGTGEIVLKDAQGQVVESFDVTDNARVNFSGNKISINPTNDLTDGMTYAMSIEEGAITDASNNIWATSFSDTTPTTLDFTAKEADVIAIHDIQGSGNSGSQSYVGQAVTIDAVITAFTPGLNGFYVQEQVSDYDNLDDTSEGIFVYYGNANPGVTMDSLGDTVTLMGDVSEYYDNTQITYTQDFMVTNDGNIEDVPNPTIITLPLPTDFDFESVEGMLVAVSSATPDGELVVTETYNLDRYGELVLTSDELQVQFTEMNNPDVDANTAYLDALANDRIIIEDADTSQNPTTIIFGRNGEPLSADNIIRSGDTVDEVVGVVGYSFGDYKIQPIDGQGYNFTGEDRPTAQELQASIGDAEITVASANVLNFFTTYGSTDFTTPYGNTQSGRGADNLEEYNRQLDKLVSMIEGLNADVVGLMEIQNNGYDENSAIAALVEGLNAQMGEGTYDYIKGPFNDGLEATAGDDAIMVGMIYKPDNVTPVGSAVIPDTDTYPAFDTGNRVPVAQAFKANADGEIFTTVVNHFKSKGSVIDADLGDGQGNNPVTRLEAAEQLKQWLDTDPTGTGDTDNLLIGDFNSYSKENSLQYLEDNDYNIMSEEFSYVYKGVWGSLDHAIASDSLVDQVTGVSTWGINAEESKAYDYDTSFKADSIVDLYSDDAYRASDHNPLLIGLNLGDTLTATENNDSIIGTLGADDINGGLGDDFLQGGLGNDTYTFEGDFGQDKVLDYDTGTNTDTFIFADLNIDDLLFEREGINLVASEKGATADNAITVNKWFAENSDNGNINDAYVIENWVMADNNNYDAAYITGQII